MMSPQQTAALKSTCCLYQWPSSPQRYAPATLSTSLRQRPEQRHTMRGECKATVHQRGHNDCSTRRIKRRGRCHRRTAVMRRPVMATKGKQMNREFQITSHKTYASKENARKAVAKIGAERLRHFIMQSDEGRWFPVFVGQEAMQEGIQFHFNVVG
jgi:hypothetical protein